MALKYSAESMSKPKAGQCPIAGHVHVAEDLLSRHSLADAQNVAVGMVGKIIDALAARGYL